MTGDTAKRRREARDSQSEMPTGQVRIIGAERAADAASEARATDLGPSGDPSHADGAENDGDGPSLEEWPDAVEPELPHWTEAPTGEVPAVLARPDEELRSSVHEPSWREEPSDWELDDAMGAPILDEPVVGRGALGETDLADRQPWSFDLEPAVQGPGAGLDDIDALEELEEVDTTGLFAPWSGATRSAETGRGGPDRSPWPEDGEGGHGPATEATSSGLTHEHADPARPGSLSATEATTSEDLAPATQLDDAEASGAEEWDPDAVAGEKTSVLPAAAPARPARSADEAAALEADLESHSLRRRWQMRRPEAVRGTTARHRARGSAPAPVPAQHGAPARVRSDEHVSKGAGRNLPVAIASGVGIGAVVLVAFAFGSVPSMIVVSVVLVLAAAEAYAAFRRAGYRPATLLGLAAIAALAVGSYDRTFQAFPVVAVVLVAATFLWHLVGVDPRAEPVRSTAATVLVFCWIGVFGSFAALLLSPSLFPHRHGIAYLLGALISAVGYDVGALAVGAALGRHPLSAVSPGKTWEGVAGGAVVAIALALGVVRLVHPWTLEEAAVLGVVVAIVSPIGDLSESLVKRHLGLKDMGRILPGHGGLLDRVDGLLFVLPATYYLLRAFGHG